jgi:hypothetical protein
LPTLINAGSGSDDSRDPAGAVVQNLTRGATNMVTNMDFGFDPVPTSVNVFDFKAAFVVSTSVKVQWMASNVTDVVGFNLYRSETPDGPRVKVNGAVILVNDDIFDEDYEFFDNSVNGGTFYYFLSEIVMPNSTEIMLDELEPAMAVWRDQFLYLPVMQR